MTTAQPPTHAEKFWLDHIKHWQDSGLSQTDYCKERDLKPHNLSYHKRKQERNQPNTQLTTPTSTGFLQVNVPPVAVLPEPLTLHFTSGLQLTGLTANNLSLVKQLAEVFR